MAQIKATQVQSITDFRIWDFGLINEENITCDNMQSQELFGKHWFHVNKPFLHGIKMKPWLKNKVSQPEGERAETGEWLAVQRWQIRCEFTQKEWSSILALKWTRVWSGLWQTGFHCRGRHRSTRFVFAPKFCFMSLFLIFQWRANMYLSGEKKQPTEGTSVNTFMRAHAHLGYLSILAAPSSTWTDPWFITHLMAFHSKSHILFGVFFSFNYWQM